MEGGNNMKFIRTYRSFTIYQYIHINSNFIGTYAVLDKFNKLQYNCVESIKQAKMYIDELLS